jgi:hypothetical protein
MSIDDVGCACRVPGRCGREAIETPAPAATTSTGKNRLPKFAIGTVVAAALALVAGLYFSGLLFTVKTHDGTLVVRIDGGEFLASVEGQKAGKSTLLNAILGMELLGAAVRECTGTVSSLQRGKSLGYRARLQSGDWEDFETVFPDQEEAFAAAAAEQQAQLEQCDAAAVSNPAEAERLEQSLQEMHPEVQTRKAGTAEDHAADQQSDYEQELQDTEQFGAEVRARIGLGQRRRSS